MLNFAYLLTLVFIIIFILYLIMINRNKCPKKVKIFFNITFILLFIRYISVLLGTLIDSQSIIYFFRPIVLLNYSLIPLVALGTAYIFLRNEDTKFDYNFIFMSILLLLYVSELYLYKVNISINNSFGFIINFKDSLTPNLIYLIIIASIAIVALLCGDKPFCNKWGMKLLTISLMLTIAEFILFLGGIKFFPYPLIGEILILLMSFKAIKTFK
ncbi:Uncharacterised protein [uncultured Clostridium sp.]|nr:Uncharacterised protein [uncultured Clostridium sp.]